jgi:hypothetical protein
LFQFAPIITGVTFVFTFHMRCIFKIIIIIIIIPFTQGIHTYIPETNHVSREYSVAAILRVLLMVHIALSSILNFYYYYYYYYTGLLLNSYASVLFGNNFNAILTLGNTICVHRFCNDILALSILPFTMAKLCADAVYVL